MRFRHLGEEDHGPVVAAVDGWWGGRRVAGKLPRLFDEARRRGCRSVRAITSPVNTGSIGFHASMGFGVLEGDGSESGVSVHRDYDGDGGDKVVFVRKLF